MEELAMLFKIRDALTTLVKSGQPGPFQEYLDNVNEEIHRELEKLNE